MEGATGQVRRRTAAEHLAYVNEHFAAEHEAYFSRHDPSRKPVPSTPRLPGITLWTERLRAADPESFARMVAEVEAMADTCTETYVLHAVVDYEQQRRLAKENGANRG